jgi:hypothetical protein
MMHVLNRNFNEHGYPRDTIGVSDMIGKYLQLIESPTINATLNNFNLFFSSKTKKFKKINHISIFQVTFKRFIRVRLVNNFPKNFIN